MLSFKHFAIAATAMSVVAAGQAGTFARLDVHHGCVVRHWKEIEIEGVANATLSSPDGQYVFHFRRGDASLDDRSWMTDSHGHRVAFWKRRIYKMNGFAWVPGRGHTLVFGAEPAYRRGHPYSVTQFIGLWSGPGNARTLHRGVPKTPESPVDEYVGVVAVSKDGRWLKYRNYWEYSETKNNRSHDVKIMRLPVK